MVTAVTGAPANHQHDKCRKDHEPRLRFTSTKLMPG